jgi:NAD(P)-dependent dehydrogenase (short-subunit alcohol dehydrogenase family)
MRLPVLANAPAECRYHRRHPEAIDYEQIAADHLSDRDFDRRRAYGRSKLGNIRLSNKLSRRLQGAAPAVTSKAVHPGLVSTNLLTNAGSDRSRGIPVEQGARTSIHLATSSEVDGESGGYYVRCKPVGRGGARIEISLSEQTGKLVWTPACRDWSLHEDL